MSMGGFHQPDVSVTLYRAVFKRRLNFVPLPEPEPLHTNYRDPLPETKLLLHPC